jgi:nitronate monooxygenase
MMHTWLSERLQLDVPVLSAPMAGVAHGRLAAAVSAAGGCGMIGVGVTATPEWIDTECRIAAAPNGRFGVGFMAWALNRNPAQLDAALAAKSALISFSFGSYAEYVPVCQAAGVLVATQVGTVEEAVEAEQAGVDVIVARGGEAGGHGRNDIGTLPLLQLVLAAVDVPVLAAGGIATAGGLTAILAAGAVGGWVGTAFLACPEANTSDAARERLFAATGTDTVYGRVFDVAQRLPWPREYGGRALRNQFFDRWVGREDELLTDDTARVELLAARESRDFDIAYIYAGQGVGLLNEERAASAVVAELAG